MCYSKHLKVGGQHLSSSLIFFEAGSLSFLVFTAVHTSLPGSQIPSKSLVFASYHYRSIGSTGASWGAQLYVVWGLKSLTLAE